MVWKILFAHQLSLIKFRLLQAKILTMCSIGLATWNDPVLCSDPTYLMLQELNFRQKAADIIYMSSMRVRGVSTIKLLAAFSREDPI